MVRIFEELRMDRRLAAGKLHHAPIDWPLAAQRSQHVPDLLQVRLIQITRGIGVGEAYRTSQIAAVGEIHVSQRGVRGVHAAQAAIVRTRLATFHLRIRQAKIVAEVPFLHLEIEFDVAEDDVAKVAMLDATLLHHHFAIFGEDIGQDNLVAFRTERLRLLGQAFLQRLDGRASVGNLGLQDPKSGPLGGDWRMVRRVGGQHWKLHFR